MTQKRPNRIALCPNLHRAFDRSLISISDDYTVVVNMNFVEKGKSIFNISQFDGHKIILQYSEKLYPDLDNISKHRREYGF
ncbi:hypothetical protein EZS27_018541 [termite gut metagenome]|uniref:HNH nuclease domain-containing protein n=1 Tax=termite gut metagenome TaxID=433724 RepID=A0A5J4RG04_9ZZZZ